MLCSQIFKIPTKPKDCRFKREHLQTRHYPTYCPTFFIKKKEIKRIVATKYVPYSHPSKKYVFSKDEVQKMVEKLEKEHEQFERSCKINTVIE